MATYKRIQEYVRDNHGFVPETCWIAHAKKLSGLPVKEAPNRINPGKRVKPCPEDKFPAINEAFRHFGLV